MTSAAPQARRIPSSARASECSGPAARHMIFVAFAGTVPSPEPLLPQATTVPPAANADSTPGPFAIAHIKAREAKNVAGWRKAVRWLPRKRDSLLIRFRRFAENRLSVDKTIPRRELLKGLREHE